MASDPTLLFVKAKAVEHLVAKIVPQDCPSGREATIQNAKLLRMLGRFLKKYEHNLDSLKKRKKNKAARREYGEDVRGLHRQEKAMQKQLNKALEEWWVRSRPNQYEEELPQRNAED
jgi:exonuclease VII large subunit